MAHDADFVRALDLKRVRAAGWRLEGGVVAGHAVATFMTRASVAFVTAVLVAACFPYATSYVHLEAPGATHIHVCRNVGPPVFASFERNGARFDVTLEPGMASRTKAGFLGVRTTADAVVTIPDPVGRMKQANQPEMTFELKPLESQNHPRVDEMIRRRGSAVHRFELTGLPPIISSGTLRLPVLMLDGARIELPELAFERRLFGGVMPLNC